MTTTRSAKRDHNLELAIARQQGYTTAEFAHPQLRAAALADRGHLMMTAAEYTRHRIGRRTVQATVVRESWAMARTARRLRRTRRF